MMREIDGDSQPGTPMADLSEPLSAGLLPAGLLSAGLLTAEVHVWHSHVGGSQLGRHPRDADLEILSGQERDRCQRLVRLADRVRFAAGHAEVRRLLAGYLDVGPAQIRFGRTPCCRCGRAEHGPPRIDWPRTDITFNQAGSGDHWLLAVSRGRRVGVDIEVPRDIDVGEVARACLTAGEQQYLAARPEAERLGLFYRCWTRKEAVLKACGIGLAAALSELDVLPGHDGPVEVRHPCSAGPQLWAVQDVRARPPLAGPAQQDVPARPEDVPARPARAGPAQEAPAPAWLGAVAQPAQGSGRVVSCERPAPGPPAR
jgi:4'-phosphopantetheinyl transferase